jgi:hypothetical protein
LPDLRINWACILQAIVGPSTGTSVNKLSSPVSSRKRPISPSLDEKHDTLNSQGRPAKRLQADPAKEGEHGHEDGTSTTTADEKTSNAEVETSTNPSQASYSDMHYERPLSAPLSHPHNGSLNEYPRKISTNIISPAKQSEIYPTPDTSTLNDAPSFELPPLNPGRPSLSRKNTDGKSEEFSLSLFHSASMLVLVLFFSLEILPFSSSLIFFLPFLYLFLRLHVFFFSFSCFALCFVFFIFNFFNFFRFLHHNA